MPRDRLHRIDGPAVTWRDGSVQYLFEAVESKRDEHDRLVHRSMTTVEALAISASRQ